MARPISSEDAKKAIEKHQSLLAKLSAIEASIEILRSEIKKISDALVEQEVMRILNAILSQRNNRRLRWRNGCLLRQNGACWREWESAAIF